MGETYPISRRRLLRGMGVGLALPWLEIMSPTIAATDSTKKPPLRLGVLFKGNGVHPPSWDISGASETDFPLSPLLEPLAPMRDKVLILSNLAHREGGGSHHAAAVAFLSGANTPGSIDVPQPVTIDQLAADRIGRHTPLRSLELTADSLFLSQPRCSYISYGVDGKPVRREDDPQIVFDRMFRGYSSGERLSQTRSILDAVQEDARSVRRSASTADRRTLDAYFDAVRGVERTIEAASGKPNGDRWRPRVAPELIRPPVLMDLPERVKALLNLMVLAFWTDSTRIASFMLANDNSRLVFDFLGINEEHHYLSHFVRHPGVEYIHRFNAITRWHVAQFAYLIDRLAKIQEGDGTLLDNTLLLFGSGLKHGDYHSAGDLPVVLAGGGGGTLKTGRWIRYAEPQPYANLLLSLLHRLGIDAPRFGSSTGPLPGLDRPLGPVPGVTDDGTWRVVYDTDRQLTARGLLRASDKAEEINIYYLQLSNGEKIKVQARFGNLDDTRFDEFCGRVVTVGGTYTRGDGETIIRALTSVRP
ncbi:MAG TPA: DUF1552 domain-containing protein [Isosphaeraceae bacterium]|nr:DUF1552 domain-containing protein [Isosphaeraceae bacterium]